MGRYVSAPAERHWQAICRIFRYVRGTTDLGLFYRSASSLTLTTYSDADWASDHGDRRSTSGFVCFLGPSVISYGSKKQNIVALSTCEAELIAASQATRQETLWLRQVLSELGTVSRGATLLHVDNQSTIGLATNPMTTQRSKHIYRYSPFLHPRAH